MTKSPLKTTTVGYRLYADKSFMDYLRPMREDRFTRMDAYCFLLDRALANAELKQSATCQIPFVVTITELAETWHWHRATVRGFLDELERRGRLSRTPATKSYLVTMKLIDAVGNETIPANSPE